MSDLIRRKILKSLTVASGAVIAGKSMPESWSRPIITAVVLPAHAQTSCTPTVVQIPSNTQVNVADGNGVDLNYWWCAPGTYISSGGVRLMMFVDSGVTVNGTSGALNNTYYVKTGGTLNISNQSGSVIYLEPGANYTAISGDATIINVCGIEFDTSVAPACP